MRDDRDSGAGGRRAAEGNLCSKSGAQAGVSGEWQLGDALENGRLATVNWSQQEGEEGLKRCVCAYLD